MKRVATAIVISACTMIGAQAQEPRHVTVPEATALVGHHERVKVTGVLLFETGPGRFYLWTETGKVRGQLVKPVGMKPGDRLEITALPVPYLQPGQTSRPPDQPMVAWLAEAEAVNLGPGEFPSPVSISAAEASASEAYRAKYDGEFVKMRGRVTGYGNYTKTYTGFGRTSILEWDVVEVLDGDRRVQVMFSQPLKAKMTFDVGSLIEFSGTCRMEPNTSPARSNEIQVLMPDLAHARVLELPPFLMRSAVHRGIKIALFAIAGMIALGAVWAFGQWRESRALRLANIDLERRVVERTAELHQALARERELGEMKSNFVSLVSHEFRTPLGVIMSAADVLERYFERLPREKRARHLEMIRRSTKNLSGLIEEVLLLSRVEEGRMQFQPAALDLERICRALCDEMPSATDWPIHFEAENSLEGAVSDEAVLRHILTNLLSNACKYSESGSPVEFNAERRDSNVVFTIRDRGIGILPEDKARLFTSFTRGQNVGNRPGSGLGLVIVQRCVQLHSGRLHLESEAGHGTVVTVTLPVFNNQASSNNHQS
jgi:signal transduction histidine kinase